MNPTAEEDRRSATEDRLRAALAARAALVTHADLRHDVPPQGRGWGVRRVRGIALGALGVAAAVAAGCVLVLLPGHSSAPAPVQPARSPGITSPSPSSIVDPAPSVEGPSVVTRP
ncbi:hypothetical protein [Kitasatospora sp. NBC_01266]|uniref:hypothetical protein n=1 Tax=Kitasatospora sp. NBC_01266 TaxID=2903572 RepID=UPI002E318EE7|nr:hypothetical protein [Kitasatospora sp. NBC_01266]